MVVLLLPAGRSACWVFGLSCVRRGAPTSARPRFARSVAALVVAFGCLVLAAFAGGTVAAGPFNPVTVPAGSLARPRSWLDRGRPGLLAGAHRPRWCR